MTKLRIVVHVGMRKAASSTLQQLFVQNKERLAQQGILYPAFQGRAYNHRSLNNLIFAQDRTQEISDFIDTLKTTVSTENVHTILFSYEGWAFNTTPPKFFQDLAERLNADLTIVLVVRQPEEYLNSWYAHRIMHLRKSEIFSKIFKKEVESEQIAYGTSFQHWSELPNTRFIGLPLNGVADVRSLMLDVLGFPLEQCKEGRSFNQSRSAYEIEIFRRLCFRQNLSSLDPQPKVVKIAQQVVREVSEEQGWPDDSFYGVTEEMTRISEMTTLESLDAFAQRTWGKPWKSVFPTAFKPSRPANMIDPKRIDRLLEDSLEAAAAEVEKRVTSKLV